MDKCGFVFPYDWSNPKISDEALILNILQRGIYEDICEICIRFGLDVIEKKFDAMNADPVLRRILSRSLFNIKKGFDRAQS